MKLKNDPINVTFPLLNLKTSLGQVLMSLYVVPALTIVMLTSVTFEFALDCLYIEGFSNKCYFLGMALEKLFVPFDSP